MPTYDHGVAGLTGTIGVTVLNADGTAHDARATAGITEPVAGSGIYHIAHPHPGTLLLFIFDGGVGTVGGSCFDDGLTTMPARAGDAMTCADATAAKDDLANATDGLGALKAILDTSGVKVATLPDVQLAATQDHITPAQAGAKMDLVDAPNATALAAIKTALEAAGSTLATLLTRIVGTILTGNHSPQSGDAYGIVNDATNGNAAIKTATAKDATVMKVAGYTAPDNASAVAAAASAASADGKLTAGRLGKLDSLTFTTALKVDASATVAGVPTVGEIDTELTANHGSGSWGQADGAGSLDLAYRVLKDTNGDGTADSPAVGIEGVRCILTSDAAGNTQVGSVKTTDSLGNCTWRGLVAGTYYVWREKGGYEFTDPDTEVVA